VCDISFFDNERLLIIAFKRAELLQVRFKPDRAHPTRSRLFNLVKQHWASIVFGWMALILLSPYSQIHASRQLCFLA
jgi:hypothetical protein